MGDPCSRGGDRDPHCSQELPVLEGGVGQGDFLRSTAWGKTSKGLTGRHAEWVVWGSEQAFE
jgi:hypothetical protein